MQGRVAYVLCAALCVVGLARPVPASATVWDFVETSLVSGSISDPFPVTPLIPGEIASTLTIAGNIDYTITPNLAAPLGPPIISGNTDFSYWDGGNINLPNPARVYAADLQLTSGTTLNGSIYLSAQNDGVMMSIVNDVVVDAAVGSDGDAYQCPEAHCYVSGYWVAPSQFAVPEPRSVAVLLSGLGMLGLIRRRRPRWSSATVPRFPCRSGVSGWAAAGAARGALIWS